MRFIIEPLQSPLDSCHAIIICAYQALSCEFFTQTDWSEDNLVQTREERVQYRTTD